MRFLVVILAVVSAVLTADNADVFAKLDAKADRFNDLAKSIAAAGSSITEPAAYYRDLIYRHNRASTMLPVDVPLKQWLDRFVNSNDDRVSGEDLTELVDLYTRAEKAVYAGLKKVFDAVTGDGKISANELRSTVSSVLANSEDAYLIMFYLIFSTLKDMEPLKSEIRGEYNVAALPALERSVFEQLWSCAANSDMDACLSMWKVTVEQMIERIRIMAEY